jgi:hypothetical protein
MRLAEVLEELPRLTIAERQLVNEQNIVIVAAVFHAARDERVWRERVKKLEE